MGACSPRKIWDFRPSEIVFHAVSKLNKQELDDLLQNVVIVHSIVY